MIRDVWGRDTVLHRFVSEFSRPALSSFPLILQPRRRPSPTPLTCAHTPHTQSVQHIFTSSPVCLQTAHLFTVPVWLSACAITVPVPTSLLPWRGRKRHISSIKAKFILTIYTRRILKSRLFFSESGCFGPNWSEIAASTLGDNGRHLE